MTLHTLSVVVCLLAPHLRQEPGPDSAPIGTKTPVENRVGPDSGSERPGDRRNPVEEDPVSLQAERELALLGDLIPLPVPATGRPSDEGDVLVSEASGDPFFLGFAGGSYYPPETELVDPRLTRFSLPPDQREGAFTYAFVMFSSRMSEERIGNLEALGCRVLGFHPHYCLRVAVPLEAIPEVSTLPYVRWVGLPRPWQKLHPALVAELAGSDSRKSAQQRTEPPLHLIVNLYESDLNPGSVGTPVGRLWETQPGSAPQSPQSVQDQRPKVWQSNGWQQHALEELGFDVQFYERRSISLQGWLPREQLEALVALDFVQFIEIVPEQRTTSAPHDESTAMITSDRIRLTYPGNTFQTSILGIQDGGVETDHVDLDLWGVGWDCTDAGDAWGDTENGGAGHGTHVAATILGRGVAEVDHLGNAPGLASWGGTSRLFNLRRFGGTGGCNWSFDAALSVFTSPYTDSSNNTTAKPHVISNSWNFFYTNGNPGTGTESQCRSLDDATYVDDQLWVFAAGNSGPGAGTVDITCAAKNVLTVGNVIDYIDAGVGDPGNLWTMSSRGPCGDGRWKPNITAPGRQIRSALANDTTGYTNFSGTSMATPHVSAVAATLVDHLTYIRYQPAVLSATLMATAITKDDQILSRSTDSHLDTYGAGRVSAYKAHFSTVGFRYVGTWFFDQTNANWNFSDFTVPNGASRLVCVMHYVEEKSSSGASQALVNDYDFYVDKPPVDPAGNSGDYWIQQSQLDNTEIRILNNPSAGTWRWKTWPESANSNIVHMAVVIYVVNDDTTPAGTLTLSADDSYVQPGDLVNISATVNNSGYIASAVVLDRSGSTANLVTSSTRLYDGVDTDLTDSAMFGQDILLGDVLYSTDRAGSWGLTYSSEGNKSVIVEARSDNMVDVTSTVNVIVDGTPPMSVTNLASTSHVERDWSNDDTIDYSWGPAADFLSGLQGYGIWVSTACGLPTPVMDLGPVTTYTSGPHTSTSVGVYFNIRSVDNSDNWEVGSVCVGPYYIDVDAPTAPAFDSSDHALGSSSCDPRISVTWAAASDAHSGVAGYGTLWSSGASDCPGTTITTTGLTDSTSLAPGTWYLHVRTADVAGNWTSCTDTAHFGPFTIVSPCLLFSDDFESGDFSTGGWTLKNGRVELNPDAARMGAWGARIARKQWIEKSLSTVGFQNIVLNVSRRSKKYDVGEGFKIRWSVGSGWNDLDVTANAYWGDLVLNLPAAADNNPNLKIRFKSSGDQFKECGEVDDVSITATVL